MQERDFIPNIGMNTDEFWSACRTEAEQHEADQIHVYMRLMLERARSQKVKVTRENFAAYGSKLDFFPGLYASNQDNWFKRINKYGRSSGVNVEHYIVSSGIREMIQGTKIAQYFKKIYASSFMYDHHGVAEWPALALNYTTKTQYLFRINKGSLDVWDDSVINAYVDHEKRPVPFENMIFIGDGLTDIPCFRLVKDQRGHSIAVFEPKKRRTKTQAQQIFADGRVNFAVPTDYNERSPLDKIVKGIIDKISFDTQLRALGQI